MNKFIGNVPENNHPYQNDVQKQSHIKLKSIDKAHHTVAVWTQKKILSTIDAPLGVPGVSKNHIFYFTNETVFLLR